MQHQDRSSAIAYRTPTTAKILIVFLLASLGFFIFLLTRPVLVPKPYALMSEYSLDDSEEGVVSARGSWVTDDTDLGNPLQTTKVECRKDLGSCLIAYAELDERNILWVNTENYRVIDWTPELIQTAPLIFDCVKYQLTINRISKTVTNIRSKHDTSEKCNFLSNELIVLTLSDGQKRIEQNRTKH